MTILMEKEIGIDRMIAANYDVFRALNDPIIFSSFNDVFDIIFE